MSSTIFIAWGLAWAIFAIPLYTYAKRIGQNGSLYVILSIVISPLFAFLLLLANGKTDEKQFEDKIKLKEMDDMLLNSTSTNSLSNSINKYEQLEKIANLKERGILSEEEFNKEKHKILKNEVEINSEQQISAVHRLNKLIKDNKSKLIDSNIAIIRNELAEICTSKDKSIQLIIDYDKTFHKNLIKTLIELSTNYNSIKETLKPFIEFGIVKSTYPHEVI